MKRLITGILAVIMVLLPVTALAQGVYESGLGEGGFYREVIYLTGKPVVLSGTLDFRPGRPRGDAVDDRYTFRLENREEEIRLDRTLTLRTTWREEGRQEIRETTADRFRETITIKGERYLADADGYQFSLAAVTDIYPGVEYTSGNWYSRKVYKINRGEGQVAVSRTGTIVAYASPWGEMETRKANVTIEGDRLPGGESISNGWVGIVTEEAALGKKQQLTYIENEPTAISFSGGYLLTEIKDDVFTFDYDLPLWNDQRGSLERNRGSKTMSETIPLQQRRLPVANFRDIKGNWAEAEIERMAGLDVFSPTGTYFAPSLPLKRGEFARALVKVSQLETEERGNIFVDVNKAHPYSLYINELAHRRVVAGERGNFFNPEGSITRAQAAVMLVNLLGLETLAPGPTVPLAFLDRDEIPLWARNYLYVATEVGLLEADRYGRIRPQDTLSRGEAAVILDNFISYLQNDLVREYRERLLNYN